MVLSSTPSNGHRLKPADPRTIQDKFMVGYQGWFTCAGDGPPLGPGHHGWLHWFNYPIPDGGRPNTDLWPDVSDYSPSELYPAPGLKYSNDEQAFLFSSRHPKTVQRHFRWMAEHGVDGAFLQRFAGQTDLEAGNEAIRNQRDEVGDRVREAAEQEGRVFAIMYDIAGVSPERIQRVIEHDWMHLIHEKGVLDSPSYLRERGRAVVTLWGFGFADTGHDPATIRAITAFIRNNTPGGAYIMAGIPAHWRTSVSDADPNPEFVNVWLEEFDALSPWTIGRYHNEETADWFEKEKIKGDVELINERNKLWEQGKVKRKIDYIPVIFPGGSGHNLSEGKWGWNDAPRQGGRFMWRQLVNVRRHGVRTVYGAMWDEYDEGTAFLPVVSKKHQVPVLETHKFMALDEDGYDLPPDWYMRICGFAGESLRGERILHDTFPSKELEDYWSTRPRYEDNEAQAGPSMSSEGKSSGYAEWSKALEGHEGDVDVPPPPYTLEMENPATEPVTPAAPAATHLGTSVLRAGSVGPPLPPPSTRPSRSSTLSSTSSSSSSGSSSSSSSHWVPPLVNRASRPDAAASLSRTHSSHPSQVQTLSDQFSKQTIEDAEYEGASLNRASSHNVYTAQPGQPARLTSEVSQATWPPTDWGVSNSAQTYPGYPGHSQHDQSYTPGYAPGYIPNGPPPPLQPRPSLSRPSPPQPYGSTHATSHSRVNEFPSFNGPPGSPGAYHPHAPHSPPPPHSPHSSYSPHAPPPHLPPSPHPPHSPHYSYMPPPGPPPGRPDVQFPQAYPAPQHPPQPLDPYGFPYPAPGPQNVYGGPYPPPPGPPPPPPRPGSYPNSGAPLMDRRPSLSSNPLGYAEARLQNLAQSGQRLWNKHTK